MRLFILDYPTPCHESFEVIVRTVLNLLYNFGITLAYTAK